MMILYFLYYDYEIHIVSPSQVVSFMMFLHSTPSVIVISSMAGTLCILWTRLTHLGRIHYYVNPSTLAALLLVDTVGKFKCC